MESLSQFLCIVMVSMDSWCHTRKLSWFKRTSKITDLCPKMYFICFSISYFLVIQTHILILSLESCQKYKIILHICTQQNNNHKITKYLSWFQAENNLGVVAGNVTDTQ